MKNYLSDPTFRNLGFYSILQTDLANIFKSYIYDWINNQNNQEYLYNEFKKNEIIKISFENFITEYKTKLFLQKEYYYLGLIDLFILNQYHQIPIILIDQFDKYFFIIDKQIVFNRLTGPKDVKLDEKYFNKNNIKIKYISSKIYLNITPMNLIVINEI